MIKFKQYKTALIVVDMDKASVDKAQAEGLPAAKLAARIGGTVNELRKKGVLIVFACPSGEKKLAEGITIDEEAEYYVEMPAFSAFFETSLDSVLMNHRVVNTLTCGQLANVCCRATAIDASTCGLVSFIISDLVMSESDELTAIHLDEMEKYFSKPLELKEVFDRIADERL